MSPLLREENQRACKEREIALEEKRNNRSDSSDEESHEDDAERRLDRARLFLESGRTDSAIAEVRNLPGAESAEGWLRDAERYAAAQRALDLIETAAVLEPRRLRDTHSKPSAFSFSRFTFGRRV